MQAISCKCLYFCLTLVGERDYGSGDEFLKPITRANCLTNTALLHVIKKSGPDNTHVSRHLNPWTREKPHIIQNRSQGRLRRMKYPLALAIVMIYRELIMLRNASRVAQALLLTLLLASCALAQAVSGNITGTVRDTSGAALPDAGITITDLERGTVFQLKATRIAISPRPTCLPGDIR